MALRNPFNKISDVFVETLVRAGVKRVYGVAGDSLNGLTDSIRAHEGIDWLMVRHEEVAAFAAGAESQISGELTVCAGSCGPGNLHLINGLHDCHRSRTPVLAIAAQVPSNELGTNYFQETRPEHLFLTCSDFCEVISTPEQLPRVLAIAMRTAIAKRCVAVIVIPGDILTREASKPAIDLGISGPAGSVLPPATNLHAAAEILNTTKKITILAGAGCANARDEVIATAAILQAPIITALRGKEYLEYDNPFYVGLNGLIGMTSAYRAMQECDTLLMLGTDFPYSQFFPEGKKVIQLDIRGEQIGRRTTVDVGLIGDVRYTLQALAPLLDKHKSGHLEDSLKHFRKVRKELDDRATGEPGKTPIHPQYLTKCLSDLAAEDAVFLTDVGTPTTWGARYLRMNGKRRLLGSYNHGTMANAMPQAIGVQAAEPSRQVVTLSGDGGFSMLMGDLLTLHQLKLPVKIVVFNNSALAFVEQEMKAAGIDNYGTAFAPQNYANIATAAGVRGWRVETPEQVIPALTEAFAHPGPALIDVVVNRQELSLPPTITAGQAVGFNLYMMKAMLHGDGHEVLDMAKTNLWR
ncbi:ubiquinone-dependent pyruvate dehydrogenase [Granulicella arctica]|uniref:ubiquinone-dependent pyruvate dehydrogenase n=1 Tax=Granulicella arctica TaxID=940613 RepID=UPI0021DF7644|nr:ubiquinone-dependent pyruvate dehydrogenase [Granulicella arctica]